MHNHKISIKEVLIILSLLVLIIAYLYYALFWTNYKRQLSLNSDIDLQSQIEVEQIKAASLANMRSEMENASNDNLGEIAIYNNQSNEIRVLSNILRSADNISITWNNPVFDGSIVRRVSDVDFVVESYSEALDIINSIYNCEYRLIINRISIDGREGVDEIFDQETGDSVLVNTPINVSLTITFFETTVGSDNTAGLVVETISTSSSIEVDYDMFD